MNIPRYLPTEAKAGRNVCSGGFSVGYHLLAYNGRDDKLFRAAISESGQPIGMGLFVPSERMRENGNPVEP